MGKYTDLGVKIGGLISQAADDLIRPNDFVVGDYLNGFLGNCSQEWCPVAFLWIY